MSTPIDSTNVATDDHSAAGVQNASVGELLSEVSRDFSTLMRQEVALAKAEVKTEVAKAGKGALSFGALHGVSMGFYGLKLLLVAALAWRLTAR